MSPAVTHLRRLHTTMAAVALSVLSLVLGACGDPSTSSSRLSVVRIVDASPDATGIDVYANNTAVAFNLGFGTVTSYVTFNPGVYTIAADQAGSKTVLASTRATIAPLMQYTLILGNLASGLQTTLLPDQSQPAPSNQVAVRIIDEATRAGALDIYLVTANGTLMATRPVITNLTFGNGGSAPGYINLPVGSYQLVVVPAGTTVSASTVPIYTGARITFPASSARTIILLDQQLVTVPGIQVITLDDYDAGNAT